MRQSRLGHKALAKEITQPECMPEWCQYSGTGSQNIDQLFTQVGQFNPSVSVVFLLRLTDIRDSALLLAWLGLTFLNFVEFLNQGEGIVENIVVQPQFGVAEGLNSGYMLRQSVVGIRLPFSIGPNLGIRPKILELVGRFLLYVGTLLFFFGLAFFHWNTWIHR